MRIQKCLMSLGTLLSTILFLLGTASAQSVWLDHSFSTNNGWRNDQHIRTTADVNGDGVEDFVGFGGAGVYVALSTRQGFATPRKLIDNFAIGAGNWDVRKNPRVMGDVNGDGKADIIGYGGAGVYVSLSTGNGFTEPEIMLKHYFTAANGWNPDLHIRTAGDINGDGRTDLVGFGGAGVFVSFSTGSSFTTPQLLLNQLAIGAGEWRVNEHPRHVADVDGDGKDDIIGYGGGGVWTSLSTGNGFTEPKMTLKHYFTAANGWNHNKHIRTVADVNHDGKTDLVGFGEKGVFVALSTHNGFEVPGKLVDNFAYAAGGWRVNDHARFMGDVTGDGVADIIAINQHQVLVKADVGISIPVAVNRVQKSGNAGVFVQTGPRTWVEVNSQTGPATKDWLELHRDQWSVYLKNGNTNLQLDLWQKKAIYTSGSTGRTTVNLSGHSNKFNAYMVSLLDFSFMGQQAKLGEFTRVSRDHWKEIQTNGKIFNFRQVNRDEWSVYLYDESRDVHLQLDLHTSKIYYRTGSEPKRPLYDITSTYGMHDPAKPGIINFAGTHQSITVDGLEADLASKGLKLVTTTELKEGECALLFPKADPNDVSAEFGAMVCNVRINDELSMHFEAVHGGCDASDWKTGGSCGITTGVTEVTFDMGNGKSKKYAFEGPSADVCGSVSPDRLCASAGGTLFGLKFTDENGNGFGCSLDAGFGGGLGGSFEDGVLSVDVELKFIVGGTISLDLDLGTLAEDPGQGLMNLGEFAYTVSGGFVRVAAAPIKSVVKDVFGEEVGGVVNNGINVFTECPFDIIAWIFTQRDVDCIE